ncbi:protein abnormal spindle [Condylostylus longicornis]|uniref:protein abnormal spindle n=1 Tax=Condylostylus longicornis TaxID=2530218 RepID=UPI00244E0870|nr:protein abnormal spindle [Condylostylus longicornis]
MSTFEVNITPTRNKTVKKVDRQPTDVILAPFSAKAIVTFEDVPVFKTARRVLNIINPSDEDVKVMLTRSLNPEYNMSLEWTSNVISSNNSVSLEMIWNPKKELQCRETIQFTDNRNYRKDISVVLKSVKAKSGTKRFPTLSSHGSISKVTLKSKPQLAVNTISNRKSVMSNIKTAIIQKQFEEIHIGKYQNIKENSFFEQNSKTLHCRTENIKTSLEAKNNMQFKLKMTDENEVEKSKNMNKENISPRVLSSSSLFDNFQFTPVADRCTAKNKDYKTELSPNLEYYSSLPTPVTIKASKKNFLEKPPLINFSPDSHLKIETTDMSHTSTQQCNFIEHPYNRKIFVEEEKHCDIICQETYIEKYSPGRTYTKDYILDTSSEQIKSFGAPLIDNKTFDLKNQTESFENLSLLNIRSTEYAADFIDSDIPKTNLNKVEHVDIADKRGTRLSSIAEIEEISRSDQLRKPGQNSPSSQNLKRDVKLIGTPLRKCSESMRDLSGKSHKNSMGAMGSMPDLNSMEKLQSIEQNRYYYQQNSKSNIGLASNTSPSSKIFRNTDLLDISNESTVSNADIYFNQSEIRAASSRFNINDAKSSKMTRITSPFSTKLELSTPSFGKLKKSPCRIQNATSQADNIDFKRTYRDLDSPTSLNINLMPPRSSISMAISPPKRIRYDNEVFSNNECNKMNPLFRVVNWKSSNSIKKLRLQKNLSLVRKQITPRKIKEEPRQMLYNSENFLQHFINPDPFAATTTFDPFLATTMYLDEEAIRKYEVEFKKWLNALVSIPSELDPNCEEKIDVGRLFNEVRHKELILAPTKEEQSMNYLTKSRMEALRSAAVKLFMSEEMCVVCSKTAIYVKKGSLKIRADRDLHLDVVMQRTILELLLCFNPLWLRLGLEVVFGEVIHLHSNSDIVGLSTFILNRLFRDKFIERKYSKAYTLSEEYRAHMKSFTLQKILFLLLFLDKAKNYRIIKHNPCLFMKKSQYKETKEILLRISSELLASVGDITRELRRLGYVLSHKQCFIDEFDYAFKNLAVDLRDGVRLTRVMEIILLRDNLTNQLRCPAISRLQRIYNVNLALKALNEADFKLKGEITAYDIVDGHREKTLSLLWQIIYKFRSPKFIAAATAIQQWWRKNWLNVVIDRRIKIKEDIKRQKAATRIQACFRGFITRKFVQAYRNERITAAICLQKFCRKYLEYQRFKKIRISVICIQRWYRNKRIAIEARSKFLHVKLATQSIQIWYKRIKLARKLEKAAPLIREIKANAKLRYEKAVVIQRYIKSFFIRKKLHFIVNSIVKIIRKNKLEYQSAVRIQAFIKMKVIRSDFLKRKVSVQKIQKFWRSYKLGKIERARFLGKRQAAIAIQTYFRDYLLMKNQREYYLKLKKSVTFVQQRFRANILFKKEKENYEKLKYATLIVQQQYRAICLMRKTRREYKKLQEKILFTQRRFRANRLCRLQSLEYQKVKHSIIITQSIYRGFIARRSFKLLKQKTIIIQRKLRATLLARKVRYDFITMQYFVILMQQRFRANILMNQERLKYNNLKNAALIIQRRFRAITEMKIQRNKYLKFKKTVTFIQTHFRAIRLMRQERKKFLYLKKSVLVIQGQYRAIKLMRKEKYEYHKLLQSIISVQRRFRGNLLMKKERKHFVLLRNSAITIQNSYRAIVTMRDQREKYLLMKNSAVIIQRNYRAFRSMKIQQNYYRTLCKSIFYIQQLFRANSLMKKQRQNYLLIRKSVILLQRKWRAFVEMRKQRKKYLLYIKSVKCIQQKYRAYKLMKFQSQSYENFRAKIIYLQRNFRANCLMKKERERFLKLQKATLFVQSKWKAIKIMRKERDEFLSLKKCAIVIQQRYRANKLMQLDRTYYENLYVAVLSIQQLYRANYLMKRERTQYVRVKSAVVKIQCWLRATFEMRKQRQSFMILKNTCQKIQNKYRAQRSMRIERTNFITLKTSILIIQRYYRSLILTRKHRSYYLKLKFTTIVIQRKFRNKMLMRTERQTYLNMRKSAIIIQNAFRSYLEMKKHREIYLKLRRAAIVIQQKYRATAKMILQRDTFLHSKNSIIRFIPYCRGFLARKRFNAAMTPEMREFIKQQLAAKIIQKYWRGYLVRKKWDNVRISLIRRKIKELNSVANVCNTVKYKICNAVKVLNGKRCNIQDELSILLRLEKLSRTVPHFLIDHSKIIATFCYSIMAQAIRSEIDKQIIEICSRIMLNLARYSTTANTFLEDGLVTIAQMLLRWCDKESDIFNTLCTLIWIFSHCPIKRRIIKTFMTTPEAIFMLRETKKLVLRKEKMRQNARRLSVLSTPTKKSIEFGPKALPSLEPDFGIIKTKPYTFVSSVFAFDIVLNSLGIKEIN